MASSTTNPVASVRPKSVIVFTVNPKICMTKNVPISETGIVAAGISVDFGFCRKM